MPVRLNKALKELNVGLSTVAEFLQKKGLPLDDASPNAKITDEQHALLMKEYGNDKKANEETHNQIASRKGQALQQKNKDQQKAQKQTGGGIFRPEAGNKKEFKVVGHIDLTGSSKKQPEQPKPEPPKPEPVAKQPAPEEVAEVKVKETETQPIPQPEQPVAEQPTPAPAVETGPKATAETPEPAEVIKAEPAKDQAEQEPVKEEQQKESQPSLTEQQEEPAQKVEAETAAGKGQDDLKGGYIDEKGVFHPKSVASVTAPVVVGKIDLAALDNRTKPEKKSPNDKKRQRNRITTQKVDVNAAIKNQQNQPKPKEGTRNGGQNKQQPNQRGAQQQSQQGGGRNKKNKNKTPVKTPELTEEEMRKQVKENLARLTSKQLKKGVKYRKDKREAIHSRMLEQEEEASAESKVLKLTEYVTANELATMMDVPVTKVIGTCMSLGIMVSINQRLDAETINIVADEFGFSTNYVSEDVSNAIVEEEDDEADLVPRAPIITVMGHVDHGKTSLLDYIRKTNVIAGEAGGITQHIGAYNVKMPNGKRITFLDTPGHEAFTAMRARGAQVTDIAIIIIAADDGIMPQTKEAISHAVAANVPMVFAINKIDKPGADPEKIKQELAAMNYLVEDWGGKYQSQEIAAKKGTNVDQLMEKVLLEAEILDLKANPNRKATGSVIESSLDKGRGYVATVLVQNGTLRQGDIVLCGTHYGRIRGMFNERGQRITEVKPAEPALILGLNGAPTAGDAFHVMETEQEARELAAKREQLKREQGIRTTKRKGLEDIAHDIAVGGVQDLNLIVKGDVDGSIEALSDALIKLSTEKIKVNIIYKAVGQISESDVDLAKASNAIIIGFQVRPSQAARRLADNEGVDIRIYSVIYDTTEEIRSAMEGMLAPEIKEENTGLAEVRQVFNITKVGKVAGSFVTEGKVHRTDKVRVIRDGIVVHTGSISALKRFKDDVKEVGVNFECGISLSGFNDIREGDLLETYIEVEVKQKL